MKLIIKGRFETRTIEHVEKVTVQRDNNADTSNTLHIKLEALGEDWGHDDCEICETANETIVVITEEIDNG